MLKRGQFFLIAALIVSTILFGLGAIFNRAQSINEDRTSQRLAEEMSYESSKLLNRDVSNGISQDNIEQHLLILSEDYALSYPRAEFVVIYGKDNIKSKYYTNGLSVDFTLNITSTSSDITASYSGVFYNFKRHTGENYFVIIKTQNEYGKFIAVK